MTEKPLTEEEIEQLAIQSALNFGPAENAWHDGYGQIIKDGELTEAGIQLFKDAAEAGEKQFGDSEEDK